MNTAMYARVDGIEVEWEWDIRMRTYTTCFSDEVSYVIRHIEEPWDELSPTIQEYYLSDAKLKLGKRCPL